MADDGRPIAWMALENGTPVVAADGEEVGKVADVVADESKDIFSGVVFRQGLLDAKKFVHVRSSSDLFGGVGIARGLRGLNTTL